jgi:hypothetical protein
MRLGKLKSSGEGGVRSVDPPRRQAVEDGSDFENTAGHKAVGVCKLLLFFFIYNLLIFIYINC